MREFVGEFTSDAAFGPEGYLADKGLIPLPDAERAQGPRPGERHDAALDVIGRGEPGPRAWAYPSLRPPPPTRRAP
jgi:hypothetical protein